MVDYTLLTPLQQTIMLLVTLASHYPGIYLIRQAYRRQYKFETVIFLMGEISSVLYHICEIYEAQIFLDKQQWHRMDNIYAISSTSILLLYLTGSFHHQKIKYSVFFVTIILQEIDPWNLLYTVLPIISYTLLGLILRYRQYKTVKVHYDTQGVILCLFFLFIALIFFSIGLNEDEDYLRICHNIWHLFVWMSSGLALKAVSTHLKNTKDS